MDKYTQSVIADSEELENPTRQLLADRFTQKMIADSETLEYQARQLLVDLQRLKHSRGDKNYQFSMDADVLPGAEAYGGILAEIIKASNSIIEERNQAIIRRDKISDAVYRMAEMLINSDSDSFEQVMVDGLGRVASAVDVQGAFIRRNQMIDGVLYAAPLFAWMEEPYRLAAEQRGVTQPLVLRYDTHMIGYEEVLSKGGIINSKMSEQSEELQATSAPLGIKSTLVVPILVKDHFWGLVGFIDVKQERRFMQEEINALRSVGQIAVDAWRHDQLDLERAAALQAKEEFISRMSHEMRTPLNAILGMSRIGLEAEGDQRKMREALKQVNAAGKHLLEVVNDILDIGELEANKKVIRNVDFEMDEVMDFTETVVGQLMKDKGQKFTITQDPRIPAVLHGDHKRLTKVLVNLLGNANKFTPRGGTISLRVSLVDSADGVSQVQFSIMDTGIGISPEQQENLFQAFEKAAVGTENEQGAGLGLAITKSYVEMLGGSLSIESELGEGTEFYFTLPFGEARNLELQKEEQVQEKRPMPDNYEGYTVMVVDDVTTNLVVAEDALESFGLDVYTVPSAERALQLFRRNPQQYSLIFMDVMMPEMDGLQCTQVIRNMNEPWAKEIPIVALTANVGSADVARCMAAGMNGHVGKPFTRDDMAAALYKHIQPKGVRDLMEVAGNTGGNASMPIGTDAPRVVSSIRA